MRSITTTGGATSWRAPRRMVCTNIPASLLDWLLDPASLTRRLQQVCGEFRVQVLNQAWARPLHDETHALSLRNGAQVFVREVLLLCDGQPRVFARTVIPRQTLSGKYRRLTRLGNKSLGAVLFADPLMRRDKLELSAITARHPLFERATHKLIKQPSVIWGRRSLFHLNNKPLLLSEIFLHDMRNSPPTK